MASISIIIPNPNTALNTVLCKASNDDLSPLVDYLKKKLSEDLTCHEAYKKHAPNHQKYYGVIAKEIRDMGGNSFANVWRKEGPNYHEIVYDVAKKLKATVSKSDSVVEMENAILEKLLTDAIGHMTEEDQLEILKEVGHGDVSLKGSVTSLAIAAFRAGGFKSYQLTLIIANQIARVVLGRGLMLGTNAALMRWASILSGPMGWVISGVWTAVDIAGPAYSVTIPCVIHIAMLRKKQDTIVCKACGSLLGEVSIKFCPECGAKQPLDTEE
ncbi:YaaW family protein [Vibrio gangliei]|uniref:YaaW family protein n=1 Tax=Vibrio gangliei TaxID=2077090 RepID=UPI000D01DA57|nr:ubiquinol-cytochrome C chaperone family protein [Vibrio gangliei]